MKKIVLKIGGMSCSACSNSLEKYLNKQEKIISANVNLVLAQALIEYEDNLTLDEIYKYIKEAGFESLGIYKNEDNEKSQKQNKRIMIFFSIIAFLILYISMAHMVNLPSLPYLDMKKYPINYTISLFILTVPFLVYGKDIIKTGYNNLIHKSPNMDTLVSIGVIASLTYSIFGLVKILTGALSYIENLYFESVAIVIYFIKLGRFVDSNMKEKTTEAIKQLVQITPTKALIKKGDKEIEVAIDEVKKDDILIAKPGMKIAVDGIIIKGITHLEESFITGESTPIKKGPNDKVVAGSINYDGYIEYKAEKIGANSTISEIVKLVVEATNTKAPIAKIADKVSSYFVPTIIIIALLTLLVYLIIGNPLNESLKSFVTVLVVACPCALGLATPLAIVVSMGLCAKNGILIKTSEILENGNKIDTIVFDKTGTLTYGNLKVSKIYKEENIRDKELFETIVSLEKKSTHPIAKSLIEHAKNLKINLKEVKKFKNIPGIGIKGELNNKEIYIGNNKIFSLLEIENNYLDKEEKLVQEGNSIVYVIENKKIISLIGVKDMIRNTTKETIRKLQNQKIETIMLTGDNETTAKIIAQNIGITKIYANIMPKDKAKIIKELLKKGKNVIMVGDGINDAPSLATATIGVSMTSSTDIATNTADVILINDDLSKIIDFIYISKKTVKNIKQNLFWAFFYNICMIPLAIGLLKPLGLQLNPMIASFAMTLSSLTVILNALNLKRIKK